MPTTIIPDTGDFDTATQLTIPDLDGSGTDWSAWLQCALEDDILFLEIDGSRMRHYMYTVTGPGVDNGANTDIPVSFMRRQGAKLNVGDSANLRPVLMTRAGVPASVQLATWSFAAYGGLDVVAVPALFPNIGVTFQKIDVFDAMYPSVSRGITVDAGNSTLSFDNPGVYALAVAGSLNHNSSNQGRVTTIRLYNETDTTPIGNGFDIGIGRNVEDTVIPVSVLVEIAPVNVGDILSLEIGGGDSLTGCAWTSLSWQVHNVGEWRGAL